MPVPPGALVRGSLLGACRARGDVERAEWVMRGTHVLLSNVYASKGRWTAWQGGAGEEADEEEQDPQRIPAAAPSRSTASCMSSEQFRPTPLHDVMKLFTTKKFMNGIFC